MDDKSAIKIAVRERPLREIFIGKNASTSVVCYHSVNSNIIVVNDRPFSFDCVLNPSVSQQYLYDELVKPLVGKVLQGFNCTALAYGQTGTGKSYTMGLNCNNFDDENTGIIPRCLKELFDVEKIKLLEEKREISASFIEIYNEKVFDLLAENPNEPIASRGYKFTCGVRKEIINIEDCYNLLLQGNKNRHVRPTKMNSQSSRSHAIFSIHVSIVCNNQTIAATLNLVDLAGSEGVRRTGHQGVAMSEGVHINQGLLTIGKVLQAITLGYKVIPYRDSVLSSVLKDSLNPNSFLTLLACISPHREDLSETLSTLRFAQNAKQLKHSPQINTILGDIKRNKIKNPINSNILRAKTSNENLNIIQNSVNNRIGYHSNTFCTPSKLKNIDINKFNQTEMIVPFKANQRNLSNYRLPTEYNIHSAKAKTSRPAESNRETLFEINNDTLSSRSSLFSLNVSTSTTIETANKNSTVNSFSPVVRKCMNELEKMMDNKMCQMIETLKNVNNNNQKTTPAVLKDTVTHTDAVSETPLQLPLSSLRHELTSIVKEIIERSSVLHTNDCVLAGSDGEASYVSKRITQPNAKCKLFATSSPVFKIPEIPAAKEVGHEHSFNPSEDNSSVTDLTESFAQSEPTVRSNTIRRSQRLSLKKTNESIIGQRIIPLQPKKRISQLQYIIEVSDGLRRSIELATRTKEATLYEDNNQDYQKTTQKLYQKTQKTGAEHLNNIVIASYFKSNVDKSLKCVNKLKNIANHKKAILELLNKGSMKELQLLPQVGQKTAYQIVTHRTLNGKFKNLGQIEKLPIWRGNAWERFARSNMLQ